MLLITVRDISVMGSYILVSANPSYSVLRIINIGDFLTRLEIIYAIIIISLLFFKVSIVYFAAVSGFSQLMKFNTYQFLINVFGVLIIIYAMAAFSAEYEHSVWLARAAAVYSMLFLFILPAATLIVAAIRKLPGKKDAKPA